jgi:hypothetical protein
MPTLTQSRDGKLRYSLHVPVRVGRAELIEATLFQMFVMDRKQPTTKDGFFKLTREYYSQGRETDLDRFEDRQIQLAEILIDSNFPELKEPKNADSRRA